MLGMAHQLGTTIRPAKLAVTLPRQPQRHKQQLPPTVALALGVARANPKNLGCAWRHNRKMTPCINTPLRDTRMARTSSKRRCFSAPHVDVGTDRRCVQAISTRTRTGPSVPHSAGVSFSFAHTRHNTKRKRTDVAVLSFSRFQAARLNPIDPDLGQSGNS